MIQQQVAIEGKGARLAGTLTLPDEGNRFPGVLLIPGSGPVDRDENIKRFRLQITRRLAHHLAAMGLASLRYDKRGVGESSGDYFETGFNDNVDDASDALAFLANHDAINARYRFVVGHSEGAFIASKLAAEHDGLSGAVLLSGSAQKLEAALFRQMRFMKEHLKRKGGFQKWVIRLLRIDLEKSQRKALDKIRRSQKPWIRHDLQKINAKWTRELLEFDPAEALSRARCPVLALTGAKDLQVDPADLQKLERVIPTEYTYRVIPNLTHLLRIDEGEPTYFNYRQQIKLGVDIGVLTLVSDWLQAGARATEVAT
jgi:pimeloyl-ACP methyl ester carboxylesterase